MKYLKTLLLAFLLLTEINAESKINPDELKKLSDRSTELLTFVQSRCVTIMQEGNFEERSGVIVSKDGYIFSSYIRSSDNDKYVIYLPDGTRSQAQLIDSDIRKGISLLKLKDKNNLPEIELSADEIIPNAWGLVGGFGLERIRGQYAHVKLARILKYKNKDKKQILAFGSCLQSDIGAPLFDLNGRLLGVASAVGTNRYHVRITHVSAFFDFNDELTNRLKSVKSDFYKNRKSLRELTVSAPADDEDLTEWENITVMQKYLSGLVQEKVKGVVQVLCNGSPSILGSVISSDGYVLTKATEVGSELSIEIDEKVYPALLYAEDPELDLAILKIDAENLEVIKWAGHNAGSFVFSPAANSDEMGYGIIGHDSTAFSKDFYNINSPDKNNSLRVVLEHASDEYKIAAFIPDSPLKTAGAEIGDTVISVNGKKNLRREDVISEISRLNAGNEISVTLRKKNGSIQNVRCILIKAESRDYPKSSKEYLITDNSYQNSGFSKVFLHDCITEAWQCGGPVFDLQGRAVGINIARHNRTATLAVPAEEIKKSIAKMMKHSVKF